MSLPEVGCISNSTGNELMYLPVLGLPTSRGTASCVAAGRPALELLKEGLRDLRDLCDILEERVEQEIPS